MELTEQEKGQISYSLFKMLYARDRTKINLLNPGIKSEIGDIAKSLNTTSDKLKAFFRMVVSELVDESLGK